MSSRPTAPICSPTPEGYISAEGRERIDAALYEIRRTTGVEFATVILPSIGERDIESFSTDLFRLWGLGSKTRNDGLLLLIVMDQRKGPLRDGLWDGGDIDRRPCQPYPATVHHPADA